MENQELTNACPVCGEETSNDGQMVFCEKCGFNIHDRDNTPPKNKDA